MVDTMMVPQSNDGDSQNAADDTSNANENGCFTHSTVYSMVPGYDEESSIGLDRYDSFDSFTAGISMRHRNDSHVATNGSVTPVYGIHSFDGGNALMPRFVNGSTVADVRCIQFPPHQQEAQCQHLNAEHLNVLTSMFSGNYPYSGNYPSNFTDASHVHLDRSVKTIMSGRQFSELNPMAALQQMMGTLSESSATYTTAGGNWADINDFAGINRLKLQSAPAGVIGPFPPAFTSSPQLPTEHLAIPWLNHQNPPAIQTVLTTAPFSQGHHMPLGMATPPIFAHPLAHAPTYPPTTPSDSPPARTTLQFPTVPSLAGSFAGKYTTQTSDDLMRSAFPETPSTSASPRSTKLLPNEPLFQQALKGAESTEDTSTKSMKDIPLLKQLSSKWSFASSSSSTAGSTPKLSNENFAENTALPCKDNGTIHESTPGGSVRLFVKGTFLAVEEAENGKQVEMRSRTESADAVLVGMPKDTGDRTDAWRGYLCDDGYTVYENCQYSPPEEALYGNNYEQPAVSGEKCVAPNLRTPNTAASVEDQNEKALNLYTPPLPPRRTSDTFHFSHEVSSDDDDQFENETGMATVSLEKMGVPHEKMPRRDSATALAESLGKLPNIKTWCLTDAEKLSDGCFVMPGSHAMQNVESIDCGWNCNPSPAGDSSGNQPPAYSGGNPVCLQDGRDVNWMHLAPMSGPHSMTINSNGVAITAADVTLSAVPQTAGAYCMSPIQPIPTSLPMKTLHGLPCEVKMPTQNPMQCGDAITAVKQVDERVLNDATASPPMPVHPLLAQLREYHPKRRQPLCFPAFRRIPTSAPEALFIPNNSRDCDNSAPNGSKKAPDSSSLVKNFSASPPQSMAAEYNKTPALSGGSNSRAASDLLSHGQTAMVRAKPQNSSSHQYKRYEPKGQSQRKTQISSAGPKVYGVKVQSSQHPQNNSAGGGNNAKSSTEGTRSRHINGRSNLTQSGKMRGNNANWNVRKAGTNTLENEQSIITETQRCRLKNESYINGVYFKDIDMVDLPLTETNKTTMMLRNIPNKYTAKMLLAVINEEFEFLYDFYYLPIDFRNRCNVGYAFINFIHPFYAELFTKKFYGYKLTAFKSNKVCEVCWGRVQGLDANVEHYRNSAVMSVPLSHYKPVIFNNKGETTPFPQADGPLPSVKLRPQKC